MRRCNSPAVIYSENNKPGIKIHLGCGPVNIEGWINIDARKYGHIHIQTPNLELSEFNDSVLEEIYLCHVLEHFSFKDAEKLIIRLKRKLRTGGTLRISVPDFDALVNVYKKTYHDINSIKYAVLGGQDYEFNYHKSIYNELSLRNLLDHCGFIKQEKWITEKDFGVDLGDWSNKKFKTNSGSVSISLNLKAIK